LHTLKQYVLSKEMYVNALVSEDAAYTVLIANIDGRSEEVVTAAKALETIQEVVGDHPYYFGGDPALILYADIYMNKDLAVLIPAMVVVMIVILALGFRRFWGVVLPLSFVILCIMWTFGLQALFGIYVNVFTPAVAVLLIAMGADYAVHIYNHYLRRGDILVSTAEITLPVVMSAVTTIAGLLTFGLTRIDLLRFFGIELAFGLGSACLLSIILLPICIYLLRAKADPVVDGIEKQGRVIPNLLTRMGVWVHGNPKRTLAVTLLGLIFIGAGAFRITTNVDFIEFMPADSPPRIGGNILRDHFSGFYPISIYFQGDMEDPALMQIENYLENYLRSHEMTSAFTSINGLISEENWLMNGVFAVPETREGIANLWLLLEGEELLRTFVSSDRQQSLITALIKEPQTDVMRNLSRSVGAFMDGNVFDQVVRIDPARLSPEGQGKLQSLRLHEAALQLAWLSAGYDKPNKYDSNSFLKALEEAFPKIDQTLDLEPVWTASRAYLDEEALEILPQELIDRLMVVIEGAGKSLNTPELRRRLAEVITASKVMDAEDAATTAAGVLHRASSALRLERASTLRVSLDLLFSSNLKDQKDFRKRADGVLWALWAEEPVFFAPRVKSISSIDGAVVSTIPIQIESTGFPDIVRRFDDLIYISQVQSMILASLVVLEGETRPEV